MRWVLQYRANKYVFKSLQKLSLVTLGSLKLSGTKFQADGPATEKARRPCVCNRWRGSTRSRRLADVLRCCREAMSETGRQRSTKYCGAWPCTQMYTMMQSLYVTAGSGTLIINELGNVMSLEIAGFCIVQISNTTDEGTCFINACFMITVF